MSTTALANPNGTNVPNIIPLEEGWNNEIKAKVRFFEDGVTSLDDDDVNVRLFHVSHQLWLLSYVDSIFIFFNLKAIDKLEAILNGGLRSTPSTTNGEGNGGAVSTTAAPTTSSNSSMFGPREYVAIYT